MTVIRLLASSGSDKAERNKQEEKKETTQRVRWQPDANQRGGVTTERPDFWAEPGPITTLAHSNLKPEPYSPNYEGSYEILEN